MHGEMAVDLKTGYQVMRGKQGVLILYMMYCYGCDFISAKKDKLTKKHCLQTHMP
jgi:hypothetical protein